MLCASFRRQGSSGKLVRDSTPEIYNSAGRMDITADYRNHLMLGSMWGKEGPRAWLPLLGGQRREIEGSCKDRRGINQLGVC